MDERPVKVGTPQSNPEDASRRSASRRAKKSADSQRENRRSSSPKRLGFVNWQFFEGQPQGPTHLRGLLMDVANQGLEFSQAIWFVLERNAIECHVIFFLQVGRVRE